MNSICNVFRPLSNPTGNFLLFSQYVEDLSRSAVDTSTYKVSPSRFVCLDLDTQDIRNCIVYNDTITPGASYDPSEVIPQYLQDAFENSVSCSKNQNADFASHNFATDFWWHLANVCRTDLDSSFDLHNRIKYVSDRGSIFGAWEDGFADAILNIDSGSSPKTVTVNTTQYTGRNWSTFSNFTNNCGVDPYTQGECISGWSASDFDDTTVVSGLLNEGDQVSVGVGYLNSTMSGDVTVDDGSSSVFDNMFTVTTNTTDKSFTFNTIVVLYDVYGTDLEHPLATDIPMGIFFTGQVVDNGTMNLDIENPVTIYSSSDDAYGAGTGWSLRICTRFSTTPQGLLKIEEVALNSGALDNVMSAQMSAVAELIRANRVGLTKTVQVSQNLYDKINEFTNTQKTNIPYIVNGFWFVNGSNTGQSAIATEDGECTVQDIINIFDD